MKSIHIAKSSHALRSFTQCFGISNHSNTLLAFLVPVAVVSFPLFGRRPIQRCCQPRRHLNTATQTHELQDEPITTDFEWKSEADLPATNSVSLHRDADAWVALLDPYLPPEFRSENRLHNSADFQGIRSIASLPDLLLESRKTPPLRMDLLTYAGVVQQRWNAVLWLVRSMLSCELPSAKQPFNSIPFRTGSDSLDDITASPIQVHQRIHSPTTASRSLDEFTETAELMNYEQINQRIALSQIWQSTGSMILAAGDKTPAESTEIMCHVYQVLALLHHYDAIPESIYNYSPALDPSVLRRPPTLFLLSSRILTTLSDAVWRAQEKEIISEALSVGAKYVYKGHELPGARYKLRVRELGVEVWLEFVLWSCVEGGWIREAAWIIAEMAKRKGSTSSRWSIMNWSAIQEPSTCDPPRAAKVDWNRIRRRSAGVLGSNEGYSADPPVVDMGPRTISSEVISALVDGLVNKMRSAIDSTLTGAFGPSITQHYISLCKSLLDNEKLGLESNSWNSIMLRMIESSAFHPDHTPQILERVLQLAPTYRKEHEVFDSPHVPGSPTQDYFADRSAASLGLLHRTLFAYTVLGNVQGALRIFRKLQSLVDIKRVKSMQEFVTKVNDHVHTGKDESGLTVGSESSDVPGFYPQIPVPILASFLDLITDAKLYDLGRWLMYANDIDGPVIPPSLYRCRILQPGLLRFATATGDADLLVNITNILESPLQEDVLRALLHCQIALEKWDAVDDLINYLVNERKSNLTAYDIMTVAKTILKIEKRITTGNRPGARGSNSRAERLLKDMLRHAYDLAPDPSKPRDFSRSQLLNQISAIFATIPGRLASIVTNKVRRPGQSHAPISVPTDAFNVLLDGVVQTHGTSLGQSLWSAWCRKPRSDFAVQHVSKPAKILECPAQDETEYGKVVTPTLQTLRIILHPVVKAGLEASQSSQAQEVTKASDLDRPVTGIANDQSILYWGIAQYRAFGLTDGEIYIEMPEHIAKPKRI